MHKVLLAIAGIVLATSCSRGSKVAAHDAVAAPAVAVAKVEARDLSRSLVLTADFRPFQEVDVMAKVAGYVKQIYVDVGDRVAQGQLLAKLEAPEMADDLVKAQATLERSGAEVARAQDEIRRAESAHQMAHLSYERLASVSRERPGLVAQQEIDEAHGKDLVAEAGVAAAKSALVAAQQQVGVSKAEQGRANTLFDYTRVTAPFAGVITKRYADTGSMIQAGTASQTQAMPLVRVSQNSLLRLILPVPESSVPTVRIGQAVEVRVPALNRSFPGKVARFADKLQLATRTMETEVDVQNPGLTLVPGMYAEVNLAVAHRQAALAAPVSAVDVDANGEAGQVLLVNASDHLEARRVALGLETANYIEVRSGLRAGDRVVIGNRGGLQAGQAVSPKLTELAAAKGQ